MNDLYHMIDVWVCGIAAYVQQIEMLFMIIHGLRKGQYNNVSFLA